MNTRKALGLALLMLSLCLPSGLIHATKDYPNKPIMMIVPWGGGGGTDKIARLLAPYLEKELGQPVLVTNKPGGSSLIGHMLGANAEPDGYTLTMCTTEIALMHWMGLTELSYKNFRPVAMVNADPAGIIVRADASWRSLEELQNEIRNKPGKLRASGTSRGGIWDVCRAGWLQAVGIRESSLPWIPSSGAAESLQNLLAGSVDVVTCSLPEASTLIAQHKVRPLATMGELRETGFPAVPTLKEKNILFSNGAFRGIFVPLQTPEPIVSKLENALERVVTSEKYNKLMNVQEFGVRYRGSKYFRTFLEEKDQNFGELLRRLGMIQK